MPSRLLTAPRTPFDASRPGDPIAGRFHIVAIVNNCQVDRMVGVRVCPWVRRLGPSNALRWAGASFSDQRLASFLMVSTLHHALFALRLTMHSLAARPQSGHVSLFHPLLHPRRRPSPSLIKVLHAHPTQHPGGIATGASLASPALQQ